MSDELGPLLDAIELAVIASDRNGTITYWSRGATALYGWSAAEAVGQPAVMVMPGDEFRAAATAILTKAAAGTSWRGVFPVRRKDGMRFHARVRLSPQRDHETGEVRGVIGVSEDMTWMHTDEREMADRTERLALALESGRMGTWRWDIASGRIFWDETVERLFGVAPGGFDGTFEAYAALIHPDDRAATLASVEQALASGTEHDIEHRLATTDGRVRWIGGAGRVVTGPDGRPVAMIGVAADITARKEAEAERAALLAAEQRAHENAEAAGERLAFLAAAGELLAQSLDYDETLQLVADLVVSRLADWCTIDLVDNEQGELVRAVVANSSNADPRLATELARVHPDGADSPGGVPTVISTGRAVLYADMTDLVLRATGRDEEQLQVFRLLGATSAVIVPLIARGRTTGALSIVSTRDDRRYGPDDLTLATELARRAAVAIDNARLYAESASVAVTLQRSLLPPQLPQVEHIEIAARYRPAQRGLDIGGDFYDVFPVGANAWCFVMGDVCGKGADAAALTGAVRWTIRAVATHEHDPRRIIMVLNDTLLAEQSHNRFCTIVVAIATRPTRSSSPAAMRWCCTPTGSRRRARGASSTARTGSSSCLAAWIRTRRPRLRKRSRQP